MVTGFEPVHHSSKDYCLTFWLYPIDQPVDLRSNNAYGMIAYAIRTRGASALRTEVDFRAE